MIPQLPAARVEEIMRQPNAGAKLRRANHYAPSRSSLLLTAVNHNRAVGAEECSFYFLVARFAPSHRPESFRSI
jgi:hypothetical protein